MKKINIAIDGPAGAGKSTIAKLAASKLKFIYVDTGAMYRAMALCCIRNNVSADEEEKVVEICDNADVTIKYVDGEQHVLLNGENVNAYIRTEQVSQMTSAVSVYGRVRKKLLSLQRNIAENNNVIMDGRDIGSNVLPNAELKIYLTASVKTRARRRYLEQVEKGFDVDLAEIEKDIEERDYRDMHRECAPLKIADGAVVLDTSDMSIEEVTDKIIDMVRDLKVIVAKSAGFCFGVKRAVDKVYEQINENEDREEKGHKKIYTFGPIIHNEEVVRDLENKGVSVINTADELKNVKDGIIVIRSHGTTKEIYDIIEENNLTLVDATCPFVKKIHKIVQNEKNNGKHIVIIGNANHPEVQGIKGWSGEDTTVIGDEADAVSFVLKENKPVCIVSQTTFNYNKFKYLVEIISKKGYDINVLDTICNATHERQAEAKEIAAKVDEMIVIGGKNSSNTQKLYEICKSECNHTYYIQTLDDLDLSNIKEDSFVGITAGASTPNNIIEEVHTNVRIKF